MCSPSKIDAQREGISTPIAGDIFCCEKQTGFGIEIKECAAIITGTDLLGYLMRGIAKQTN